MSQERKNETNKLYALIMMQDHNEDNRKRLYTSYKGKRTLDGISFFLQIEQVIWWNE